MPYQRSDGNESEPSLWMEPRHAVEHGEAPALEVDEVRTCLDSIENRSLDDGPARERISARVRALRDDDANCGMVLHNEARQEEDNEGSRSDTGALLAKARG